MRSTFPPSKPFAAALAAIQPLHSATIVSGSAGDTDAISFRTIAATPETPDVEKAFAAITPDTIAKFLFTSGSTGTPKAVINTQRMLTSSQQAKAQTWTFLEDIGEKLVILDWLPWSHTFGANHNFNLVLRNGGTLYVDGGKPAPGLFATSLANLRSVMPTVYFNVPRGFDMLIAALRGDEELRTKFFSEVKFAFYAGAALPQNLWDALEELSIQTVGRALPMVSAWGSTETSPLATDCHFQAKRSGNIGVPIPGTELKLVPSGDKLEVRVRGPNVTPGYWKAPELTAQAFDSEGFYLIGDAVTFADPARPELGLFFDGRVAEDFKLNSGTWVSVGTLRVAGIAALAPLAQDIVVTGHGGDEVRFLVFPNIAACRAHAGLPESADVKDVIGHDKVRTRNRAGPCQAEGAKRQFVGACDAGAAAGRDRIRRRRRDHRQGLHQPARGADAAGGRGSRTGRRRFNRMDRLRRLSRRNLDQIADRAGQNVPPTILLPRQLNCGNFRAIARSIDRAVQLPCRAGRKRMQERMGPSRPSAAVRPAARRDADRTARDRAPFDQVLLWPVTAPRFSCSRRSRSIKTSRSSFFRQDNSRRSRSIAATITLSWIARPRAVSEIAWVRPSSGAVRIATRPRFCSTDRLRLTGPLSKPITEQMREAGMPGSIASSDMIRHSVTLTPKLR